RRRGIGLEGVAVYRLARHAHGDVVGECVLGITRAQAALAEFRDVVRHQREAAAGTGREIARATRAVLAADAFEPPEKITQKIRCLLQPLPADFDAWMH